MAKRDYYEVLGVGKSASPDEIKKAYRTLARQHHPDVNKAAGAESRFKEIQEAYEVLSDEKARARYDRHGHAPAGMGMGRNGGGAHYTWSNVGGGGSGGRVEFDLDDLGSMFDAFFSERGREAAGGGAARAQRRASHPRSRAADTQHEIEVPFETVVRGGTRTLTVSQGGKESRVEVPIPPGVADGARIRVRGAGARGGDLMLVVRVRPHPLYRRDPADAESLDLYLDLPLSLSEAVLGGRVVVPTFGEGSIEITIPPGTSSGRKLRLRGRGIRDAEGRIGDLYAVTRLVVPTGTDLSEAERAFVERVAARAGPPRPGPEWTG